MTNSASAEDDIDDLILPELAELVNAAAAEAGADITVDAEGLRKILAYAAGGRVHGDSPPPEPPPSPMSKSLLVSPFRHRTKAIVPVEIHRRGGGSYTAHYDNVAKKWVKKPQAATGSAPAKPPETPAQIPDWESLKDKYKNPGQWLEATFKTEEERDAARATDSYRKIVEQWADEKGRQWGAGDPREKLKPVPEGPPPPEYRVEVESQFTGEAADSRLAEVLKDAWTTGAYGEFDPASKERLDSYAKSVYKTAKLMPRRARDLLADGMKRIKFAADKASLSEYLRHDTARSVAMMYDNPAQAAKDVRFMFAENPLSGRFLDHFKDIESIITRPDLVELLSKGPRGTPEAEKITEFVSFIYVQQINKTQGMVGGNYESATGEVYLDGPMNETLLGWAVESGTQAVRGVDEGRYRLVNAADQQTDIYAHEFTHAIDRDRRFSGTPHWKALWEKELGGDETLAVKAAKGLLPKDKKPLTVYAAASPQEGFAEVGRLIYSGDCDLGEFGKKFPGVRDFFRANGLWPEGDSGTKTELEDVFLAKIPTLGAESHLDLMVGSWREIKALFTGRFKR